jgi:hypothetical protein
MLVTLSSLQPFFGNGLEKVWHFLDNVGAEAPGIQEERESLSLQRHLIHSQTCVSSRA